MTKTLLLLSIMLVGHKALSQFSFQELVELQQKSTTDFEDYALRKGFAFSHSYKDSIFDRITFVYYNSTLDTSKFRLERILDTIHFKKNDVIITTIEYSTDKDSYLQALAECKKLKYYDFGSYSDLYKRPTIEYRYAAKVGKFITGQKAGQDYFIISTSFSPR